MVFQVLDGHLELRVVKRSHMERMTLARYFPLSWKRQQPLWGSASTGKFQAKPIRRNRSDLGKKDRLVEHVELRGFWVVGSIIAHDGNPH